MTPLVLDTETELFAPGYQAPKLACVAFSTQGRQWLRHWTDTADVEQALVDPDVLIVGHNIAYDMLVFAADDPGRFPLIFSAYAQDRVTDTEIREKLLDIAKGRYRGLDLGEAATDEEDHDDAPKKVVAPKKIGYSLDACAQRRLGRALDKETWRLGYAGLRHLPLDQWPEGARHYPLEDVRATHDLFACQELEAGYLEDQFRQTRAGLWIKLMTCWGIHTNRAGVRELARRTRQDYEQLAIDLRGEHQNDNGRCRLCRRYFFHRPTSPQALAVWEKQRLCPAGLKPPLLRPGRVVRRRDGRLETVPGARIVKAARARLKEAYESQGLSVPMSEKNQVCLDSRACNESGDPVLVKYGEFASLAKILNTDVLLLEKGVYTPIHSYFEVLQETGRTGSSGPNIQNPKRRGGIRECFVPRPGYVFAACDYSGAELCTLGQVCTTLFGRSALADAMNAGKDPHMMIAEQILSRPYEELKGRHKLGKKADCRSSQGKCHCDYCVIDNARQTGKVSNFGFPGGLGYKALIEFALAQYDIRLSEEESKKLKKTWFLTWPEMRLFFQFVDDTIKKNLPIEQFFSRRFRGDTSYTARCNTLFQGLAADMAKDAGWRIAYACYVDTKSPLFGCRIVNFIHDEFILEVPEHRAHEAAHEVSRHMTEAARRWLQDVRCVAEPVLMRYWSKDAKPIVRNGRLVPWPEQN